MKKLAIVALTLSTVSAFAWEMNVKTGFDFYRDLHTNEFKKSDNEVVKATDEEYEKGWTIGAEIIPYNKKIVELGAGFEYNFGVKTANMLKAGIKEDQRKDNEVYQVPIYALAKVNLVRSKDNTSSLYVPLRLGYSISNDDAYKGLYFGTGVGFEVGPFVVEGVYNGTYNFGKDDTTATPPQTKSNKNYTHRAGLRVGFRFGDYKFAEPEVVEEVVEAPVVEEVVALPTKVESKGRLVHASCDFEAKKCIIHGFKVDDRTPNAEEKANLAEIAELLNANVKSATVELVGHTDSTGSVKYNQKLSEKRAESVNKLLREAGLKEDIVVESVSGKNESMPMATNKTKAGRYLNRRVEILFGELNR